MWLGSNNCLSLNLIGGSTFQTKGQKKCSKFTRPSFAKRCGNVWVRDYRATYFTCSSYSAGYVITNHTSFGLTFCIVCKWIILSIDWQSVLKMFFARGIPATLFYASSTIGLCMISIVHACGSTIIDHDISTMVHVCMHEQYLHNSSMACFVQYIPVR